MRAENEARSDAELLRASGDDAEAFGAFYERHVVPVVAFFAHRTGDAAEAADLASETFVAAFLARGRYRDTGAPARAWLFTIARRQLGHYRRRRRVSERYRRRIGMERVELADDELDAVEGLVDLQGFLADVQSHLDELPTRQAEAIRLRVLAQLPYAEVARRLSCSEGAARVRVCRGLSTLAQRMEAP